MKESVLNSLSLRLHITGMSKAGFFFIIIVFILHIYMVTSNMFMMCLSLSLAFNSFCLSINKVRDKSEILPPFALQTHKGRKQKKKDCSL